MTAGLHGVLQTAEFHGEEQQVHRLRDSGGVSVVEIAGLSVEKQGVFAVALCAGLIGQDQYPVFSQGFGQQMCVKGAQRAKTDDTGGFAVVIFSFSKSTRPFRE